MGKKTFLIDIDGVACDHAKSICAFVNKDYGISSKKEDVATWDHDFGPITFKEAVDKYYPIPSFIEQMSVSLGFSDFLGSISKTMTVLFATARRPGCHDATISWIKKNIGFKYEPRFVEKKIELDFDYLIDDSIGEILAAAEKGRTGFLLSQPWNNSLETKKRLSRQPSAIFVNSFRDVLDFLNQCRE